MGINKFADMSEKEFEKMLGLRTELQAVNVDDYTVVDIQKQDNSSGRGLQGFASSIDWRTKGVLNPIRDQGSCGSCYSFSAICSLEAIYKISKGSLPQLSEQ